MAQALRVHSVPGFRAHPWPRSVAWLVAAAMLGAGCTTVKSKQLPPEALQAQIRHGSIVRPGDQVSIVSRDGMEHTFEVSAVGTDAIVGTQDGEEGVTIPIDDVLALQTREISVGRTAAAGVGVYMVVGGVLLALAMQDFTEDVVDAFLGAIFSGSD